MRENKPVNLDYLAKKGYKFKIAKMNFIDISSTELREKIRKDVPIEELIPKEAEEYINGDDEDDSMKDVNTLMKAPYILFILVFVALLVEVLALHRYDSKILNIVHIIYLIIVWIDDFFSIDVIMDSNFAEDKKHGLGMLCLMVLVVSFVLCLVFIKYNQKVLDDKTPQVVA